MIWNQCTTDFVLANEVVRISCEFMREGDVMGTPGEDEDE
jgi:hypothetical protein